MSDYIDQYRDGGIYDSLEYGSPYVSKGVKFARQACMGMPAKQKVLCIGCGCGWEVVEYLNHGHDAYGTEVHAVNVPILSGRIINAVVPNLPFKYRAFDLVHCTEVLEHVPTDSTDAFLKELRRVGKKFIISIADEMDEFKTHCNLQTTDWWIKRLEKNRFTIKTMQWKPVVTLMAGNVLQPLHYATGYWFRCE